MQKGQTANARENKKMRHLTFKTSLLSHLKFRTSPAETRSTERGASRYHAVPNVFARRNLWLFSDKEVGRTPCERQCVKETQNTVIKLKHSLSGEVPREGGRECSAKTQHVGEVEMVLSLWITSLYLWAVSKTRKQFHLPFLLALQTWHSYRRSFLHRRLHLTVFAGCVNIDWLDPQKSFRHFLNFV